MNNLIERKLAYEEGKASGKNSTIEWICGEIEDILDRCAHDNGENDLPSAWRTYL